MNKHSIASLALTAALTACGSAFADTVNLSGFSFSPAPAVSVASPNYSGVAGQFSGTLNGNSFVTYCADLLQSFSFNTSYSGYSVVDGVAAWGAAKSLALDQALSLASAAGWPGDADQSAVVQAAVWEILYEASGSYGFGSGTFKVSASDVGVQSYLSDLDSYVWDELPVSPVTLHVSQLLSRTEQDFLVTTPVPEPASHALMAAGLAAIGFVARRRPPQA